MLPSFASTLLRGCCHHPLPDSEHIDCKICYKTFSDFPNLKLHKKCQHRTLAGSKFFCVNNHINKLSAAVTKLKDHIKENCDNSDSNFQSNANINRHMMEQTIPQLDGESDMPVTKNPITVIIGNRPHKCRPAPAPDCFLSGSGWNQKHSFLRTIRRDNRGEISIHVPVVAVYNHRSVWKCLNNFRTEFNKTGQGLTLHSDIWEHKE